MIGQTVVDQIMDDLQVFTNMEPVTIALIIVSVVGVIAFIKFLKSR